MSSTVIAKNVQIGADGTASNNFTIFQPATPDGTLRIGNGNTGITSSLVAVTSAGNVGIGTSSPQLKLVASNGGVEEIALSPTGGVNSGTYIQSYNRNTSSYLHNTNFASSHTWYSGGTRAVDIDSSGNLLVGTTSQVSNARFSAVNSGSAWAVAARSGDRGYLYQNITSSGIAAYFTTNNDTNFAGQITVNNGTTSYATSSDYRLKEQVQPMTGALERVAALKPCTYTWKNTGEADEGFIAHELQEVCPSAVTGEKDAVDAEGKPVYQGIDTSFLVATLTAALQELKAIVDAQAETITALTARVTALEGQP